MRSALLVLVACLLACSSSSSSTAGDAATDSSGSSCAPTDDCSRAGGCCMIATSGAQPGNLCPRAQTTELSVTCGSVPGGPVVVCCTPIVDGADGSKCRASGGVCGDFGSSACRAGTTSAAVDDCPSHELCCVPAASVDAGTDADAHD